MSESGDLQEPIVFFDGLCNLCSFSVEFILKRETRPLLKFCSLQSDIAQTLLAPHVFEIQNKDSVLLLEKGKLYAEDKAAIRISRYLKSPWKQMGYMTGVVPHVLLMVMYRMVARNRYRIFGKKDSCYIPETPVKHRFL